MRNRIVGILAVLAAALVASSCATTGFVGPDDFVSFRADDAMKTSFQTSALMDDPKAPLVNTYDQECTYDEKGNLVKLKLTEYVDLKSKDKKFIVWETEYKVVGGFAVPASVSVNGVAFLEVEYESLVVPGSGAIRSDISKRSFNWKYQSSPLSAPYYFDRTISLENYTVQFRADDKFVKKTTYYGTNGYFYDDNTLTLGWDNLALKRFFYSQEKLAEGFAKTYSGYNSASAMFQKMSKGINATYSYDWKVIAGKICQTKMVYEAKTLKLEANMEFNANGQRTKESWILSDPSDAKKAPRTIFEQNLSY